MKLRNPPTATDPRLASGRSDVIAIDTPNDPLLFLVTQAATQRLDADQRYRQAIRQACTTHSLRQVAKAAGVSSSRIWKMLQEQDKS